jgi:phytoene synthase
MTDLDAEVRRVDEDRWLASRFAAAPVREALTAIYAFNHEVARTAEVVSQAAIGDIRLAWWRDALAEIYGGAALRAHPVVALLAKAIRAHDLPRAPFDALIEARHANLEAAPLADWAAVEAYVDATAGGVMRLALKAANAEMDEKFVTQAAQMWGLTGLLRARGAMAMHGHALMPRDVSLGDALERASAAQASARAVLPRIPAGAFPACGYVALAPAYADALRKGRDGTPLLIRQFRLIAAAATGRY